MFCVLIQNIFKCLTIYKNNYFRLKLSLHVFQSVVRSTKTPSSGENVFAGQGNEKKGLISTSHMDKKGEKGADLELD